MRLPWHASMALALCASTFGVMPLASAEITGPFAASVAFLAPARPDDIPLATVPLGFAANYSILSKAGISTTGTTAIVGPIGVSPIAGTAITGFSLTMQSANRYSTSPRVVGGVYAASYAAPTPAWLPRSSSTAGWATCSSSAPPGRCWTAPCWVASSLPWKSTSRS